MPVANSQGERALPPSGWVSRFIPLLPAGATVLDLACGKGRHGRLLHDRGHPVLMVDKNVAGVADLVGQHGVELLEADLELGAVWPLADRRFDVVIVTNYLHRPLFESILDAVAVDGLLIYETFAQGNARFGRPSNPDYLLNTGELLQIVPAEFEVLAFEDTEIEIPRPAVVQRIAARRLRF